MTNRNVAISLVTGWATLVLGCSGMAGTPATEEEPPPSLIGYWSGSGGCGENGDTGTRIETLSFARDWWIMESRCIDADGNLLSRPLVNAGKWKIDGTTVTRTFVESAGGLSSEETKEIVWHETGEAFTTHPFTWEDSELPEFAREYALVSRDLPSMEGNWHDRGAGVVVTFAPDGAFRYWYEWEWYDNGDSRIGQSENVGAWSNQHDGVIGLENASVYVTFPGQLLWLMLGSEVMPLIVYGASYAENSRAIMIFWQRYLHNQFPEDPEAFVWGLADHEDSATFAGFTVERDPNPPPPGPIIPR